MNRFYKILFNGYKIVDESPIPKTYIHAPYLAIIKGAYLAIKNNIKVYKMEGWNAQVSSKVDEWFGKSFPLKFKYSTKDVHFWVLTPIREKRAIITDEEALSILKEGTQKTKEVAKMQLSLIKEKMFK